MRAVQRRIQVFGCCHVRMRPRDSTACHLGSTGCQGRHLSFGPLLLDEAELQVPPLRHFRKEVVAVVQDEQSLGSAGQFAVHVVHYRLGEVSDLLEPNFLDLQECL